MPVTAFRRSEDLTFRSSHVTFLEATRKCFSSVGIVRPYATFVEDFLRYDWLGYAWAYPAIGLDVFFYQRYAVKVTEFDMYGVSANVGN